LKIGSHHKFWDEAGLTQQYVCNDSEQYLHLVSMGKMTYEVLNEIQEEQSKAYDYMIKKSLETNEKFFKKDTKNSLDLQKVIEIKIEKIETYITQNKDLHYEVILPRLHRGIKLGAKFIIPEQYKAYSSNDFLDVFLGHKAPYRININGKLVSFPTDEQMKYAQMEVYILWLRKLKEYQNSLEVNGTKATIKTKSKSDAKVLRSYKWQGKKEDLNELYNEMNGVFIGKETSIDNFRKVFEQVDTKEIAPVKWCTNNATESLYFIHQMMEGELIKKENRMNYIRLKACFCKSDGSSFDESFKELYQPIKNGLTPERPDIIALIKRFQ
jgi:hypothetical protein